MFSRNSPRFEPFLELKLVVIYVHTIRECGISIIGPSAKHPRQSTPNTLSDTSKFSTIYTNLTSSTNIATNSACPGKLKAETVEQSIERFTSPSVLESRHLLGHPAWSHRRYFSTITPANISASPRLKLVTQLTLDFSRPHLYTSLCSHWKITVEHDSKITRQGLF